MAYEVWDVANVAAYPNQENGKETTARPVIIIEDLQDEVLLCPITSQLKQKDNYKNIILVLKDSEEGKAMGITFDSLIVLDRILPLKKIRLAGKIGSCPDSIIEKIEEMLSMMRKNG